MERPFSAYSGNEPYAFVCYAHADANTVYPELTWLRDLGYNIWYDEGISPGEEWTQELANAIEGASHFLFFVSSASIESRYCRNEIQYATTLDKPILAIHLEPTQLSGGLSLSLGLSQAIFRHELKRVDYEEKLTTSINNIAQTVQAVVAPKKRLPKKGISIAAIVLLMFGFGSFDLSRHWIITQAQALSIETQMLIAPYMADGLEQQRGIAVMPFHNLTNDANDYYSEGIAAEVLNALARSRSIPVIARASSFTFRDADLDATEIGRKLGVTFILEGRVFRRSDQLVISVELIDALTGTQVWSESFTSTEPEIFEQKNKIAQQILQIVGDPNESQDSAVRQLTGTTNLLAHQRYLEATQLAQSGKPKDLLASIQILHEVVKLDDQYVEAWQDLGIFYQLSIFPPYEMLSPGQISPLAIHALRRVLALDADNENAMAALGIFLAFSEYEWVEGERLIQRAIHLNPENPRSLATYSIFLTITGHSRQAAEYAKRAYRLNPYDFLTGFNWAMNLLGDNQPLEALAIANNMKIYGAGRYDTHYLLAGLNVFVGRTEVARDHLARAKEVGGEKLDALEVLEGHIIAQEGDREIKEKKYKELFQLSQAQYVSGSVLFASDDEEQIKALKAMYRHRDPFLIQHLATRKPFSMPQADWYSLLEDVRFEDMDIGPAHSQIRTLAQITALRDWAATSGPADLKRYTGTYEYPNGQKMVFVEHNGGLVRHGFHIDGRPWWRHELVPTSSHKFEFVSHLGANYTFREVDGEIAGVDFIGSYTRASKKISTVTAIDLRK
jgi:TolB-like protein